MAYKIDFSIATSDQIEKAICKRLEDIRLTRNMTQARLAEEAGVSLKTIKRLEKGSGVTFDTFIRTLIALKIQQNLEGLLPDPSVRPMDRINLQGSERKRASSEKHQIKEEPWSWDVN
jgi:transcriptional regulator with XRE-family HTH domain